MPTPNIHQLLQAPEFWALDEDTRRRTFDLVSPDLPIEEKFRLYQGQQFYRQTKDLNPHQLSQRALAGSGLAPAPAGVPPDPDMQGVEITPEMRQEQIGTVGQLILGTEERPTFGGFMSGAFDLPETSETEVKERAYDEARGQGLPHDEAMEVARTSLDTGKAGRIGRGVLHGMSLPVADVTALTPETGAKRGLASVVNEFISPLSMTLMATAGPAITALSKAPVLAALKPAYKTRLLHKMAAIGFGGFISVQKVMESPELWSDVQKAMETDDPEDWAIVREGATRLSVGLAIGGTVLGAGLKYPLGPRYTPAWPGRPAGLLEAPRAQLEAGAIRMPGRQDPPPPVIQRGVDLAPGEGALVPFRQPKPPGGVGSPLPPMLPRPAGRLAARFAGEGPALLERGAIRMGPGKAVAEAVSRETKAPEQTAIEFGDPARDSALPGQYRARELGSTATVLAGKQKIPINYALVSNAEIVTSHGQNLAKNPNFPQNLQPRRRESKISDAQITEIANTYNPEQVAESYLAGDGAPIVGVDMLVEGGNARTLGLRRAYSQDLPSAQRYKEWLAENAERFGFSSEAVMAIDDPQLVRLRATLDPTFDREGFVQDMNAPERAVMSPTEMALQDSSRVTDKMLDAFSAEAEGDLLLSAKNRDFVRDFVDQVVPPGQRAGVMTAAGQLSAGGLSRIRNAIFAKAYKDPIALERLAEAIDDQSRNVTQALLRVAPSMVKVDQGISKGVVFDRSISNDVAKASGLYSELQRRGLTPTDYLNQGALFGTEISAVQKGVLSFIERNSRSAKKIGDVLTQYNKLLVGAGNPNQQGMFGAIDPPSKIELWKRATSSVQQDVKRQAPIIPFSPMNLLRTSQAGLGGGQWLETADAVYKPPRGGRKKGILYVNDAAMALMETGGPALGAHLGPKSTSNTILNLEKSLKPGPAGESLVRRIHGEKAEGSVQMLLAQVRQASADGATMIVVDKQQSLSEIKGTIRHERVHAAQLRIERETGVSRLVDTSKILQSDFPVTRLAINKLIQAGYPNDTNILIDEVAARVIGGGPKQWAQLGMTKDQAKSFAMEYVLELTSNAGRDALKQIDTFHPTHRSIIDARTEFAERIRPHRKQAGQLNLFGKGEPEGVSPRLPGRRPGSGQPGVRQDVEAFRPLEELPKLIASEGGFLNLEQVISAVKKFTAKQAKQPLTEAGFEIVETPVAKSLVPLLNTLQSPSMAFPRVYRPVGFVINHAIRAEQDISHQTAVNLSQAKEIYCRNKIKPAEDEILASYLNDPKYDFANPPTGIDARLVQAFRETRKFLDDYQPRLVAAARAAGRNVPDDWGIQRGFWMHLFEGDHAVLWRGKPIDDKPFHLSQGDAANRARDYVEKFPERKGEVQVKLWRPRFAGDPRIRLSKQRVLKMVSDMRKEGLDTDEAWDIAWGVARTGAPQRSFSSMKRRRLDTPGWMTSREALFRYVRQAERYMGMAPLRREMEAMRDEIQLKANQGELGQEFVDQYSYWVDSVEGRPDKLTRWINEYAQDIWPHSRLGKALGAKGARPMAVERFTGAVLATEAMLKLGLSAGTVLGNLSQYPTNTLPVLGFKWATRGLEMMIDPSPKARKFRERLFDELGLSEQSGKIEAGATLGFLKLDLPAEWTKAVELRGKPLVIGGRKIRSPLQYENVRFGFDLVKNASLAAFQGSEYFIRGATALGAYGRLRSMGKPHSGSREGARAVITRTMFHYGPADTPYILRASTTLAPAMQFKRYMLHQIEFMYGLTPLIGPKHRGFSFDDRSKEAARFLLALFAVTGLSGFPGSENFDDITEWLTSQGRTGVGAGIRPFEEMEKKFPRAMRGIPGLLLDVDISQAAGFADWLSPRELSFRRLAGPFGTEIMSIIEWGKAVPGRERNDAFKRLLHNASPQLRRLYMMYQEGVIRDPRGRPVLTDATVKERVMVALGASPTRLVDETNAYYAALGIDRRERSERAGYIDDIIRAEKNRNPGEAIRLKAEAQRKGHKGLQRSIDGRKDYLKATRLEGLKGRVPKKTLREIERQGL